MASNKTLTEPGAISFKNLLLGASLTHITDEDPKYPARNLINPSPGEKYRTRWKMDTNTGYFRVAFKLKESASPTMLGIIRSNITATDANWVRLTGSNNADFSSTNVTFDTFPYYDGHNNIWLYYIDTDNPTSGTYDSYLYWAFDFYPNDDGLVSAESYYEFGTLWLGTYSTMGVAYGAAASLTDSSARTTTKGGVITAGSVNPYYEGRISLKDRPRTERQAIMDSFRDYGHSGRIVVDVESNNSTPGIRGHGQYYCKLDDTMRNKHLYDGISDLDIKFSEVPT